jgi:hypothetical protein
MFYSLLSEKSYQIIHSDAENIKDGYFPLFCGEVVISKTKGVPPKDWVVTPSPLFYKEVELINLENFFVEG